MPLKKINPDFLDEDAATSEKFPRFLRTCLNARKRTIPPGSVLQLQQILNTSTPQEDHKIPRSFHQATDVLKVVLTDGDINLDAFLYQASPELNMNTPPGTKIRTTKPVFVSFGTFSLSSDVYEVLGGHVTKLVDKWNRQRKLNVKQEWGYNSVGVSTGGPPQWKPFGYNATAGIDAAVLREMKAMDIVNEQKEGSKQGQPKKTQFDVQRDQAPEEVRDKSLKHNWSPPAKNLIDKELVDPLNEGFPLEEALKKFKNPNKTLKHIKDTNQVTKFHEKQKSQPKEKGKWRNNRAEDEDAEIAREYQRPSESISLFGFIEQHIKPEATAATKTESYGREKGMEEFQLALNMSVKSYKQESQSNNSNYDGENKFPSLHDKFARSKSENTFQDNKAPQSRNFGDRSAQYSTNNYTRQSPSPTHQNEYTSQCSALARKDYQSNSRPQETPIRHTKNNREKDSDYRQVNSSNRPTDCRRSGNDYNARPNDYPQRDSNSGNNYYRRTNDSESTVFGEGNRKHHLPNNCTFNPHTIGAAVELERSNAPHSIFSNSSDVNRGRGDGSPFIQINHFQYCGREEDRSFDEKGKNEFRSGECGKIGSELSGGVSGWRNNDSKGNNDYYREYTQTGYGSPPTAKSFQPSYELTRGYGDTAHTKYTGSQWKYSNESQGPLDDPRGGYDRHSKDIPDRKTSQYNPNPDTSAGSSHNNYGYSSPNPYETPSTNFSHSYDPFQNQARPYSNTSGPSNDQNEYYSNSSAKMEPFSSSSAEKSKSGYDYDLHDQKNQEESSVEKLSD